MHKERFAYLPYAVLVLTVAAAAGMLIGSWRLVLYPSILLFGVLISLGMRSGSRSPAVRIPAAVVALLLTLFIVLDLMGLGNPSGEGLVLGLSPLTALYFFGVGPAVVLVGLLYGLAFPQLVSDTARPADSHTPDGGSAR